MASPAQAPAAAPAVDASFSVTKFWNETFVGTLHRASGTDLLVTCLSVKEDDSTAYEVFVIGLTILTGIVTIPALIVVWDKLSTFCASLASSVREQQNASGAANTAPAEANNLSEATVNKESDDAVKANQTDDDVSETSSVDEKPNDATPASPKVDPQPDAADAPKVDPQPDADAQKN